MIAGSGYSAAFFLCAKETQKADAYRAVWNADPDSDAGSVVRCCSGFAPFYSTGAKADVWIRPSGLDPYLIF